MWCHHWTVLHLRQTLSWLQNQIFQVHIFKKKCAILFLPDDVIQWKHFPRYWPFVRGIHQAPGNSPHKGQWRGALMFSTRTNGCVNHLEACDMRHHRAHYDVTVMVSSPEWWIKVLECTTSPRNVRNLSSQDTHPLKYENIWLQYTSAEHNRRWLQQTSQT